MCWVDGQVYYHTTWWPGAQHHHVLQPSPDELLNLEPSTHCQLTVYNYLWVGTESIRPYSCYVMYLHFLPEQFVIRKPVIIVQFMWILSGNDSDIIKTLFPHAPQSRSATLTGWIAPTYISSKATPFYHAPLPSLATHKHTLFWISEYYKIFKGCSSNFS